jgi:hypothetical protein
LPLNIFGGSLGTGRIHGLWHIIEGALQASGRAGSRQATGANVSFVGARAPIVTGTTFIFGRSLLGSASGAAACSVAGLHRRRRLRLRLPRPLAA